VLQNAKSTQSGLYHKTHTWTEKINNRQIQFQKTRRTIKTPLGILASFKSSLIPDIVMLWNNLTPNSQTSNITGSIQKQTEKQLFPNKIIMYSGLGLSALNQQWKDYYIILHGCPLITEKENFKLYKCVSLYWKNK
jgi:hypothetical protein